jgi:hypothetical protein
LPNRGRRFRAELAVEAPEHSEPSQDERGRRLPPAASSTLRALLEILLLLLLRRSSRRRRRRRGRRSCGAEGAGRIARGAELAAGCWYPSRAARRNCRCSVSWRASSSRQRFPRLGDSSRPSDRAGRSAVLLGCLGGLGVRFPGHCAVRSHRSAASSRMCAPSGSSRRPSPAALTSEGRVNAGAGSAVRPTACSRRGGGSLPPGGHPCSSP